MKFLPLFLFLILCFHLNAQQDQFEPNNDFDSATAIEFGQTVKAAITERGDKDYYKVDVVVPGVLSAFLRDIPTGRFYDVKIYNTNQQELTTDRGSATDPAFVDRLRCNFGTNYILIEGANSAYWSTDQYELVVSFDNTDVYECNNSFEDAVNISFGDTIRASIYDDRDKDYYKIEVPKSGVLSAFLKNVPSGRFYDVKIFNANQQELTSDRGSATDPAFVDRLRCNAGTNYILVEGANDAYWSTEQYELIVYFDDSDIYECNNSFEDAASLKFGETIRASIYDDKDKDYFKVEIPQPGVLSALLRDIPSGRFYDIKIFNADQQELTSDRGSFTDPAFVDRLRCNTGTNYILVEGANDAYWSSDQYELIVFFDTSDIYECNNSFEDAVEIQFGDAIIASVNDNRDEDYFKVNVPSSGVLSAFLRDIPSGRFYDVTIFNTNQQELISDRGSTTDPAFAYRKRCNSGVHYIRIKGANDSYWSADHYELTVFFDGNDVYECNDVFADAYPINTCTEIKGTILPDGDIDYYEVNIAQAGSYSVFVRDVPGNIAMDVKVIDEFGTTVSSCTSAPTSAAVKCDFSIAAAGIYFIEVRASSSRNSSVDLYALTFSNNIPCSPVPEICNNGQDDDGDGLIDCADPDCSAFADCVQTNPCENTTIVLTPTITLESCAGNDGSIVISPSGGTPPYRFTWNNNTNGASLSNLSEGTYGITVIDSNGCEKTNSYVVINNCNGSTEICNNGQDDDGDGAIDCADSDCRNAPLANFSWSAQANGTVSFQNTSQNNPITFEWQFGDGTTSSLENPNHTYSQSGNYTVSLTVITSCGVSNTTSLVITIEIDSSQRVSLYAGEVVGNPNEIVRIPIVIENQLTISLIEGELEFDNLPMLGILGVQAGAIMPVFNANSLKFSYFSTNGGVTSLEVQDTLFFVEAILFGNAGEVSNVDLTNTILLTIEEDELNTIDFETKSGKVCILGDFNITGNVRTYWNAAISDVELSLKGVLSNDSNQNKFVTGADGNFSFNNLQLCNNCELTAEKGGEVLNGLSTSSLQIAQNFILGSENASINSPFQIVAGDANCDGIFNTLDLLLIQRVIVGLDGDFADCPNWKFIPNTELDKFELNTVYYPNFPYPEMIKLENPTESEVVGFTGVKTGNILGRANPAQLQNNTIETRSKKQMVLKVEQSSITKKLVEISLNVDELIDISAYQLELGYDTNEFLFKGITGSTGAPIVNEPNTGQILLSWFDVSGRGTSLTTGQELVKLRFEKLGAGSDKESTVFIQNDRFASEVMTTNGKLFGVTLQKQQRTYKIQNRPNPTNGRTIFSYVLLNASTVKLSVTDLYGKVVFEQKENKKAGKQEQEFDFEHLPDGIYHYTLTTDDFVITNSMVITH